MRVGIVGGGQLGRMMAYEAKKMGFFVSILDPTLHSPAGQVADNQILANFNDEKAILKLAQNSDYLTFEIENTNGKFLDELEEKTPCQINPSGKLWRVLQDKLAQKNAFRDYRIKNPKFLPVNDFDDLRDALRKLSLPFLLKVRFDAYDGRGNFLVKKQKDLDSAWKMLNNRPAYAEEFIRFDKELAVMVARDKQGRTACYPVVETIQKNHICHFVLAPAQISDLAKKRAKILALGIVDSLEGVGVFGVEMFKTSNDEVLVNEISPRVHNSGHYTIEACITSQFEQHIRAIAGLPLGSCDMIVPAAVMANILGQRQGLASPGNLEKVLKIPGLNLHIYGKKETRLERKMGHITVVGKTINTALVKARKAREYMSI